MKRLAALTVRAGMLGFVTWAAGATIRDRVGARESVPADLVTGAAVLAGMAAVWWADRELDRSE